jgi:hypothetical protein
MRSDGIHGALDGPFPQAGRGNFRDTAGQIDEGRHPFRQLGKPHQELHVDGGAMAQLFLYPPRLMTTLRANGIKIPERERHAYLIRNARLDPDWQAVERSTMNIAGRAINSLIHSQGVGDLYRIYLTTQRDGLDFNLAYIGADFNAPHKEEFDNAYMRALFDYGFQHARNGYPWQKTPPGVQADPPAGGKENGKP